MTKIQASMATLLASFAGCNSGVGSDVVRTDQPLELRVECAADSGMDDPSEWLCPDSVQVDCNSAEVTALEVLSPSDQVCDANALKVTHSGQLTPGSHDVQVRDENDDVLCTSEVVVVRTRPIQLVAKPVKLWPPNHKLHDISIDDCVEIVGACPGEQLEPRFIWASSDEPVNAKGDGNHEPDIVLGADCQQLALRSERQGPKDGRVYTLGVRLVDDAGETYETTCTVGVDHDQRGRDATAGNDAYRLEFDGSSAALPNCIEDDEELR